MVQCGIVFVLYCIAEEPLGNHNTNKSKDVAKCMSHAMPRSSMLPIGRVGKERARHAFAVTGMMTFLRIEQGRLRGPSDSIRMTIAIVQLRDRSRGISLLPKMLIPLPPFLLPFLASFLPSLALFYFPSPISFSSFPIFLPSSPLDKFQLFDLGA